MIFKNNIIFLGFKMDSYKSLTSRLIEEFGDRKKQGRLSIIVNLLDDKIYPIPKGKEHIEFGIELVGDIRKLSKVIPSHIDYRNIEGLYEIYRIITGESGMEEGYGVRHSCEDLNYAHSKVFDFVHTAEDVFVDLKVESRIVKY